MIVCISLADFNAQETINTLKYANHACNIQHKLVINRDPMSNETLKYDKSICMQNFMQLMGIFVINFMNIAVDARL